VPGPPKFQITSRKWNIAAVVGSIIILALGFGGLFYIQKNVNPTGGVMLAVVIAFGILTALLFVGPGALYPFRKRTAFGKKIMPGGTMSWIRSHMYLPILALVAAIVHASMVPFLTHLTSGVILLVLGVLVSIGGLARHHMIGLKKEALNVNVAINKMAQGQPRHFRELVNDFVENRKPLAEIDAEVSKLDSGEQVIWREIRKMSDDVEKNFPREGGQSSKVLQFQSWRALHPIITILFFAVLAWHVWDVLGGTQAAFGSDKTAFVASNSCADCHDDVVQDWKLSSMADAQTGTIMEAQLPVTLGENEQLATDLGATQQALFDAAAKTCINCHAPVGAPFAKDINTLLPLNAKGSAADGGVAVSGGNAAVNSDGIGCITCHTQQAPPAELAGFGPLPVAKQSANTYGIQYGPLFTNPDPVPIPKHGMDSGTGDWWSTTVGSSQLCGACHNVKVDLNGNGLSPVSQDNTSTTDADGNFTLDQNELDVNADGQLQDLVLQTTFDEWQDYVAGFSARIKTDPRNKIEAPLGCTDCHMPTTGDGKQAVVDFAPGLLSKPDRTYRSHMFVGVDYDLDTAHYTQSGFPSNALQTVLDARQALIESAVTLEVVDKGANANGDDVQSVVVQNNLLGHNFPTGFAFARQFWLEVTAKTADGKEVCLTKPSSGIDSPCSSGVLESPQDELRQCDPASIQQALAADPTLNGQPVDIGKTPNIDIKFSAAFPANDCDPWLTNYQKILTDGDPKKTGIFTEVAYQSFLPDIVKLRTRVATNQVMRTLDPVREKDVNGQLVDQSSDSYDYVFDTKALPAGTKIIVTAKMRFRHVPPYFVKNLAEGDAAQKRIPEQAKITDPDALLKNLVITDMVSAETGGGAVLACKGPQNEPGASVFSCIGNDPTGEQGALGSSQFVGTLPSREAGAGFDAPLGGSIGAAVAAAAGAGWLWLRRRARLQSAPVRVQRSER
jgi:hypothetical protein